MANENTAKGNLHRYLQVYKGKTLSYETVKDLMSFVFDMVKDPNVTWVSQDSHIRLLSGIFKRIDQTVDDKSIAGIEDAVCSAFVINNPAEMYDSLGRLIGPGRPNEASTKKAPAHQADSEAVPAPEPKDKAAAAADYETIYRRLHLELITFENKITKTAEAAAHDSRDAAKRMMLERIELESRLAIERAELASSLSRERTEYRASLDKEHDELENLIKAHLKSQEDQSKQAEHTFDTRIQALASVMAAMKDSIEASLKEHTQMQTAGLKRTEGLIDARINSMEQKLHKMEEKATAGRKSLRHLNVAAVIGMILMAAGFLAVIYFK